MSEAINSFPLSEYTFKSEEILKNLNHEERAFFYDHAHLSKFRKGQVIFQEKGVPTGIYLILAGKIKKYKTSLNGKQQIFYLASNNEIIGAQPLLCNEYYSYSTETVEACELLFLTKEDFNALLLKFTHVKDLLLKNSSHELGVLINIITVLAQKTVRERIAFFLIILLYKYGYEGSNSKNIEITLTRDDFSNLVGTARENLTRLLYEFKKDSIINISGRSIQIIQLEKLTKIANI